MDFSKTKIERNGEVNILTLNVGMSTFCLYVNECILDSADEPSRLHLFVLCDSASEGPVAGSSTICLLQRTSEEAKFRLVSASVAACFHVPRKLAHEFDPNMLATTLHSPMTTIDSGRTFFRHTATT